MRVGEEVVTVYDQLSAIVTHRITRNYDRLPC
jgi:hypothetical protein